MTARSPKRSWTTRSHAALRAPYAVATSSVSTAGSKAALSSCGRDRSAYAEIVDTNT